MGVEANMQILAKRYREAAMQDKDKLGDTGTCELAEGRLFAIFEQGTLAPDRETVLVQDPEGKEKNAGGFFRASGHTWTFPDGLSLDDAAVFENLSLENLLAFVKNPGIRISLDGKQDMTGAKNVLLVLPVGNDLLFFLADAWTGRVMRPLEVSSTFVENFARLTQNINFQSLEIWSPLNTQRRYQNY